MRDTLRLLLEFLFNKRDPHETERHIYKEKKGCGPEIQGAGGDV